MLYEVITEAAARAQIVPQLVPTRTPSRDAYGVQIVPLKHISAAEMADILKPFAPPEGILRVDSRSTSPPPAPARRWTPPRSPRPSYNFV